MDIVGHGAIYVAIHDAYDNGATIAGSSAGAAVMTEHMITGKQFIDSDYNITFKKIIANNIELRPGLGFVTKALIDEHFIVRSRYNRLLTAMQSYPKLIGIGIDESTAIIVKGDQVTVVGNRQVVVFSHPKKIEVTKDGFIKYRSIEFSMYTAGDTFMLK
jgi:cyanophycinase